MRGRGVVLGMLLVLAVGTAEASVGDSVKSTAKNVWSYLFQPVNCVVNLGADMGKALIQFGYCVLGNANRNPVTLNTVFTVDTPTHE